MLFRSLLIAVFSLAISPALAQAPVACSAGQASSWNGTIWTCVSVGLEGLVNVRRVGGTWQGFNENGVAICATSATKCVKETIAYAKAAGLPTHVFGLGSADPFSYVDQQIVFAAGQATTPVHCWGCEFRFDNRISNKDGLLFDTTIYSGFYNSGGRIVYCGNGFGLRFQPKTSLGIIWTMHNDFELGSVQADSTCPNNIGGLVALDITQACNPNDQTASAAFVNNHLTGFLIGGNKALANVRYYSPTCSQAVGGENWFFFWDNKDSASVEVNIGTYQGASWDANLGTNMWIGNIAHTQPGSGYAVMTNSADDVFLQSSINVYNAGPLASVYFGLQGANNIFSTVQTIIPPGGFFQAGTGGGGNVLHRP